MSIKKQFGFVPRRSTSKAIFLRPIYGFHRLGEGISQVTKDSHVGTRATYSPNKYITLIIDMYNNTMTSV